MSLFLLAVFYAHCLTSVLLCFAMPSESINAEDELHSVPATCGFGASSHGYEIKAIFGALRCLCIWMWWRNPAPSFYDWGCTLTQWDIEIQPLLEKDAMPCVAWTLLGDLIIISAGVPLSLGCPLCSLPYFGPSCAWDEV